MLPWKCTSCVIIRYSRPNGAHPLSYLVNMSHLICEASRQCATPAEGAGERVSEWALSAGLNIVCEREHWHAFIWKCVHYEPREWGFGLTGEQAQTPRGSGRWREVTWRDETGAEEISRSETWKFSFTRLLFTHTRMHTQPRHCQECCVGSSIFILFFYFLTVYLGSAHWAQSQTDTPEVQRHLQKYFTQASRQVWISGFLSGCQSGRMLCLNILTFIGSCTANILIFSFHFEVFFPLKKTNIQLYWEQI